MKTSRRLPPDGSLLTTTFYFSLGAVTTSAVFLVVSRFLVLLTVTVATLTINDDTSAARTMHLSGPPLTAMVVQHTGPNKVAPTWCCFTVSTPLW